MECGPQDLFCQLAGWLSENDLVAPWLVEVIGRFGGHADGIVGAVSQFIRDYGQSIVGLIGVTFGFWRWWRYREHILHKRLAEYLRESDARLANGTTELIELIQRPAPGQQFKDPLFIDKDLRVVLRERNWDKTRFALSVEASSDSQLAKAIKSIEGRLVTAHNQITSLHVQLASAHGIRGAIAASQAGHTGNDVARERALEHFRSARSVPGSQSDPFLLELEAHQQRKLGLATAEIAYQELCGVAEAMGAPREIKLLIARAKRHLAELLRRRNPLNAWLMVTAADEDTRFFPGSLFLQGQCEPLNVWERLEKGHTHYFAALSAHEQDFGVAEPIHLGEAETAYRRVLTDIPDRRLRWGFGFRRLRARAVEGLKRVAEARTGIYDPRWLP